MYLGQCLYMSPPAARWLHGWGILAVCTLVHTIVYVCVYAHTEHCLNWNGFLSLCLAVLLYSILLCLATLCCSWSCTVSILNPLMWMDGRTAQCIALATCNICNDALCHIWHVECTAGGRCSCVCIYAVMPCTMYIIYTCTHTTSKYRCCKLYEWSRKQTIV